MAEISIGSVLAGYRIEGVAGEGGMGRVYRATQIGAQPPGGAQADHAGAGHEADFRARFSASRSWRRRSTTPTSIPVYEAGEADGRLFIAMRWVEGTDLRSVILREGRLDPARAVAIVEQVAAALDAAHSGGLVHRDVKPANVMLTSTHGQEHVYLTDFGLTKRAESAAGADADGRLRRDPGLHAARSRSRASDADARTDVYALGCLLFHALTGRPPYDRDTDMAKMYAHLHDPPPSAGGGRPGDAGRARCASISRALAKEPMSATRLPGDLARAARAALAGGPRRSPSAAWRPGSPPPAAFELVATAAADARLPSATPRPPRRRRRAGDAAADAADSPPPEPPTHAAAPSRGAAASPSRPTPPSAAAGAAPPPAPPGAPGRGCRIAFGGLLVLAAVAAVLAVAGVFSGGDGTAGGAPELRRRGATARRPRRTCRRRSRPSRPATAPTASRSTATPSGSPTRAGDTLTRISAESERRSARP